MGNKIEFSFNEIKQIASKYTEIEVQSFELIASAIRENDIRLIYSIGFKNKERIIVKINRNKFTTHERIRGWTELVQAYIEEGIYCPRILKLRDEEEYSFQFIRDTGESHIVYGEEFKKYKSAWEYAKEQSGERKEEVERYFKSLDFKKKVAKVEGKIANKGKNRNLVPWSTAYVLYDKFSEDDLSDENYEFALKIYEELKEEEKIDRELLEKIWGIYNEGKSKLEEEYRKLPKAVFQGDLNWSNLLIDEDLELVGLIDFNLSGTETILNYVICEGMYFTQNEKKKEWISSEFIERHDNHLRTFIKEFSKYYKFSEEEIKVANRLFNILYPFRFPYMSAILYLKKEGQYEDINYRLQWIYYELTRNDVVEKIFCA